MLVCGEGWLDAARICDTEPTDGKPDLWEYRGYVRGPCAAGSLSDTSPWNYTNAYPDLTDAATGGVLLGRLPRGMLVYDHGDEDGWEIREPMAYGSRTVGEGSTLAEACARALIALESR
jgi:hypothetical protein